LPPGHARVRAICDWIHTHIDYQVGTSTATTTARDVFTQRAGVCRDFAHLGVTFCRALNPCAADRGLFELRHAAA
jgi:transglutaminase-like putative cysteine protease